MNPTIKGYTQVKLVCQKNEQINNQETTKKEEGNNLMQFVIVEHYPTRLQMFTVGALMFLTEGWKPVPTMYPLSITMGN